MNTWRRLLPRAALAGVLVLGAAAGVVLVPMLRITTIGLVDRQLTLWDRFDAAEAQRCGADPAGWSPSSEGWSAYAYTEALAPLSTGAPNIPSRSRWEHALLGRSGFAEVGRTSVLRPFDSAGPCKVVLYQWTPDDRALSMLAWVGGVGLLLLLGAGVGWLVLLFVRPLLTGIDILRRGARRVGRPDFALPQVDIALQPIAETLRAAHVRLELEQAQNAREQASLERHLDAVAHDLRTPLASLALRLEGLAGTLGRSDRLDGAFDDVQYMAWLVGNLHQATRFERGPPKLRPTVLASLLDRIAGRFRVIARRRGVALHHNAPDAGLVVAADEDELEQALTNLVHNAIVQHDADDAGAANVALTVDRAMVDGHPFAVICVCDDGPGMPAGAWPPAPLAEHRPREDGRSPGGLGLSIVAEVMRRHGWTLDIADPQATPEDDNPRGLTVRLRLPLMPR